MTTQYSRFERTQDEPSVEAARCDDESERISPLMYMLAGYLFLMIFRPFEYWPGLGEWRIERIYMLFFMGAVFLSKNKKLISSPLNGTVILLGATLLVSGIFSLSWDAAWQTTEGYFKLLIFYFLAIMSVRTDKDYRFLLFAFIGIMFMYVGKSAWEYFVHGRYGWSMGMKRMTGIDVTYGAPNSFSASICFSLPILWALIRSKPQHALMRYGLWAYGALALVSIIFTGSRSGMFTALLFFFLVLITSSKRFGVALLLVLLLFFTWELMPDNFQERFLSTFMDDVGPESAHESAAGRMAGFMQGMHLFASYPILGVGPGNFPLSWPEGMNAHNLFGQLLGELGLCGLISFGALLVLIVSINLRILRTGHDASSPKSSLKKNMALQNKHLRSELELQAKDAGPYDRPKSGRFMNYFDVHDCIRLYSYVAIGIIHTLILIIFKGLGDHNLYRYTWLWLAVLTALGYHFFRERVRCNGHS